MITYIIIGIIVQLVIIAVRAGRFPGLWSSYSKYFGLWEFWTAIIMFIIFNVTLWPLSIVCEIYNIIKKQ